MKNLMKSIPLVLLLICASAVYGRAAVSSQIFASGSCPCTAVTSASPSSSVFNSSPWDRDKSYTRLSFDLVLDGVTSTAGASVIVFSNVWVEFPAIVDYPVSDPSNLGRLKSSALGEALQSEAAAKGP